MKPCVVIPCYNHSSRVGAVAQAARTHCPVIVVDDGSTIALPAWPGCEIIRLERHSGKGAALRAGMKRAAELGFTHAISMDADGQHFASDIPTFIALAEEGPGTLVLGRRDFFAARTPLARRLSNAVSNFWFRVETGIRLDDTQCGFRCYPLSLARRLEVASGGFAFELEFLVRAAWAGTAIVAAPVQCVYGREHLRQSHFRPVRDFAHIAITNAALVFQSFLKARAVKNTARNSSIAPAGTSRIPSPGSPP